MLNPTVKTSNYVSLTRTRAADSHEDKEDEARAKNGRVRREGHHKFPEILSIYYDITKYKTPDLQYISEFPPHQVLRFDIEQASNAKGDEVIYVYALWNGKEMLYFNDVEDAYNDLIVEQRELKIRQTWTFVASPLIISGLLAIALLVIIGWLVLTKSSVPPELWSIFTAVVAFYFGKEGWSVLRQKDRIPD